MNRAGVLGTMPSIPALKRDDRELGELGALQCLHTQHEGLFAFVRILPIRVTKRGAVHGVDTHNSAVSRTLGEEIGEPRY